MRAAARPDDSPYDATPQTIDITDAPITFNANGPFEITEGDGTNTFNLGTISDQGTDPSPDPTYSGTIDWGDGSTSAAIFSGTTVEGVHTYADEGSFTASVNVQDDGGSTASGSVGVDVADASIGVSVGDPGATEGKPLNNSVVGTVTDNNPNAPASDLSGTIDWGDGPNGDDGTSTSPATFQAVPGQPGVFNILGSHTYKEEGGYDMVITVNDKGGSSGSSSNMFDVADAAVNLSPTVQINGTEGISTGVLTVATLTDDNPNAPASDFANNVWIDWGDGNADPGTLVSQGNGTFLVQGSNTYAEEGQYTIGVSAYDVGGSAAAPVNSYADIKDAPISLTPVPVGVIEQVPTGTMTIATLNDTNTANTDATDFYGTFECSDGTNGQLSFVNQSPGVFAVQIPSDTFSDEGTFNVSYTANDVGGAAPATGSTTISVAEGAMAVSLASPIIQGSTDGKTNLDAMTVTTHVEPAAAWSLVMSEGDAAKIDVWTMATPGPNDQPLLGLVNGTLVTSTSWAPGVPVPSTLYVGAYHGSQQVGDIQFALGEADSATLTDAANSLTYTAVRARITSVLDPNNDGMTDLTDQTRNLLVGQMVHDTVTLEAPSAWQSGATYSWGVPPGNLLYSYTATGSSASQVALAADNGPLGGSGVHTGTSQQDIQFFCVTVPTQDPASIQATVTIPGLTLQPVFTTINVQAPTTSIGMITTGTATVYQRNGGNQHWRVQAANPNNIIAGDLLHSEEGIKYPVAVKLPDWVSDPTSGNWGFTQLIDSSDKIALGGSNWHAPMNGTSSLDGGFPTPASSVYDPQGNNPSVATLKTGTTTYTFFDCPADDLSASHSTPENPNPGTLIDHETRYDQFTTYVMFQAPGSGSQWVPVKVLNWSWNIDVIKNNSDTQVPPNGTWQFRSVTSPNATGPNDPTAEPLWSQLWALTQWADG